MSVQVASNRFIVSSLHAGFYQQLPIQELANRLINQAESSIAFRQVKGVEEAGLLLSSLPGFEQIGHYYQGWALYRKGEDARSIFEDVIENSEMYRTKALTCLAAIEGRKEDYALAYKHYTEALRYANAPSTALTVLRSMAAIKSIEGNHSRAVKDLENLLPFISYARPIEQCQYWNSLAVEFSHAGRVEEAGNVCRIMLASPYAFAYPEWRETSNDIALRGYKSRSVISFTAWNIAKNVLYLPESSQEESTQSQPGTVSTLEDWKKKMVKEPNGEDENINEMDEKDLIVKLLQLTAYEGVNETKLRKIVEFAIKVMTEKD